MPLEINYLSEQRKLLIDHLLRDVRATADEAGIDVEAAFLDVAVRDFGYDIERGFRTDSSGDFGFDYLEVSEREAFIFQSKSIDADPGNGCMRAIMFADSFRQQRTIPADAKSHSGRREIGHP
jgi:hypothetical protein